MICLFSHTQTGSLRRELEFLYNRPRLNVAISRAKTISILITSDHILEPPVDVLVKQELLEGYSYLKHFEQSAWRYDHVMAFEDS